MSIKGTPSGDTGRPRRAGAFDIRVVIAALFSIFGVIILLIGIFATSDADLEKAGGTNINLWTGIGLLIAAAVFALWAWLRPIVVDPELAAAEDTGDHRG